MLATLVCRSAGAGPGGAAWWLGSVRVRTYASFAAGLGVGLVSNSVAHRNGVKPGDEILAINDVPCNSSNCTMVLKTLAQVNSARLSIRRETELGEQSLLIGSCPVCIQPHRLGACAGPHMSCQTRAPPNFCTGLSSFVHPQHASTLVCRVVLHRHSGSCGSWELINFHVLFLRSFSSSFILFSLVQCH